MAQQPIESKLQPPGLGVLTIDGQHNAAFFAEHQPTHAANFVNPERFTILPEPYGDAYLGYLPIFVAGPGEVVITPRLFKGLREHYEQLGIIQPGQLVEIPHRFEDEDLASPYAFPHGDVLERMARQVSGGTLRRDMRTSVLLPTIIGEAVREQAKQLGMQVLDTPSSDKTNNKEDLRDHAEEYGIDMMPGVIARGEVTPESLAQVIADLQTKGPLTHGVWVKLPGGSGGDTVLHVQDVTPEGLTAAIAEMRVRFDESAEIRAAKNLEDSWPDATFAPNGSGLIIELDANNLGDVLVLGSAHGVSAADGTVNILGHFRQITVDGSFVGSSRYYPDERTQALIDDQIRATAKYNADRNGYHGIQGPDYVVIRTPDGQIIVRTLELNTRPIISTYAWYAAEKLGVPHWINTNITLGSGVASFEEFAERIGPDMVYNPQTGEGVLLLASRSVVGEEDGEERVIASPHAKVLVLAQTPEGAEELLRRLQKEHGVQLGTV